MITNSFFDLTTKDKKRTFEIEHLVDSLNWSISCKLFLLCFLIIAGKVYWSSPIECYTPVAPSVKDFEKFVNMFGWIYPKYSKMPTPSDSENTQKQFTLNYYMWTPFYLSLAAILLYLPHSILSYVSKTAVDVDLQNSIYKARSITRKTGPVKPESMTEITNNMKRLLKGRRTPVTGIMATIKQWIYNLCPLAIPSKRQGTVLTWTSLVVSSMYLIISLVIVVGMAKFVGYTDAKEYFQSLRNIMGNQDQANEFPRFPRLAYVIMNLTEQTTVNHYPMQCVLPINMLWEKLFVMLSIWMMLIVAINVFKLISMLWNTTSRRVAFVKDLIRIRSHGEVNDIQVIGNFTEFYLKHDGVLILQSLASNSGRATVSHIVWALWTEFLKHEQQHGSLELVVPDNA